MTRAPHNQNGAALLVALVMLLLLTLLATSSLRDSTLQNRLSGTLAERQHASNAADSAVREGERRLQTLGNAGRSSDGMATCDSSIAALASVTNNLCVLSGDPLADSSKAGVDWWTANTLATNYTGSDSNSSFPITPRWNAAHITENVSSSIDVSEEQAGKGAFYYRVSAAAKADGGRFPVVLQSVYRIYIQ